MRLRRGRPSITIIVLAVCLVAVLYGLDRALNPPEPDPEVADAAEILKVCVRAGDGAFDSGATDPYWREQGRAKYRSFVRQSCAAMQRRGLLRTDGEPAKTSEYQRVAALVLQDMVKRGEVPAPTRAAPDTN